MFRCVIATIAALLFSGSVHAQMHRNFPANALRGSMVIGEAPQILLNAQPARLGAGVRIRDQANLQPRPAALIGMTLVVNYTLDPQGLVKDVWVLTPDEAARKPWPTSLDQAKTWQFDPVAQTWTKP
jgi:hypothetical protein